jgi:hypothetical protein
MDIDYGEIFRNVDRQLAAHPNVSPRIIAERLGVTVKTIEEALREIEGVTFQEYRDRKRLEQAFRQLGELSPAADGPYEITRVHQRWLFPKTTVRYRVHRFRIRKSDYSGQCPLVDLSRSGLAFLADQALEPPRRLSMQLKFPGGEETVQLEGRVVYSVATGIAGYRYRVGVQFLPFAERRGFNSPKILDTLVELEKMHTS